MKKKLFMCRVEIVMEAKSPGAADEAVSEALRPHMQRCGGVHFLDWRFDGRGSPGLVAALPDWADDPRKEEEG